MRKPNVDVNDNNFGLLKSIDQWAFTLHPNLIGWYHRVHRVYRRCFAARKMHRLQHFSIGWALDQLDIAYVMITNSLPGCTHSSDCAVKALLAQQIAWRRLPLKMYHPITRLSASLSANPVWVYFGAYRVMTITISSITHTQYLFIDCVHNGHGKCQGHAMMAGCSLSLQQYMQPSPLYYSESQQTAFSQKRIIPWFTSMKIW